MGHFLEAIADHSLFVSVCAFISTVVTVILRLERLFERRFPKLDKILKILICCEIATAVFAPMLNSLKNSLLKSRLSIQELATEAKAGDFGAYATLEKWSKRDDEPSVAAKAAVYDIDKYFEDDRDRLTFPIVVDPISKKDPGLSEEELVAGLATKDPALRIAFANSLAIPPYNSEKRAVDDLCKALTTERDLRVVARLTRTISILTGEDFKPLNTSAVQEWWKLHRSDSHFRSPYGGFLRAQELLAKRPWASQNSSYNTPTSLESESSQKIEFSLYPNDGIVLVIPLLDETISVAPDALCARAQKAYILLKLGRMSEAAIEFDKIEKKQSDFRWLLIWRSLLFLREGKRDEAVTSLNRGLKRSPGLERYAAHDPEFAAILQDQRMILPSKSTSR